MEKIRTEHGSYASQNCTLGQPGMFCKSAQSHKAWSKKCLFHLHKKKINSNRKIPFFQWKFFFFFNSVLLIYVYVIFYFILFFFNVTSIKSLQKYPFRDRMLAMSFCLCLVVVAPGRQKMPTEWGSLLWSVCRIHSLKGTGRLGQEKGMDLLHSSPLTQRNQLELGFLHHVRIYDGH